jgi:hypothetical protein
VKECSFEKLEVVIVGASEVWFSLSLIGFGYCLLDSTRTMAQWVHEGLTRDLEWLHVNITSPRYVLGRVPEYVCIEGKE